AAAASLAAISVKEEAEEKPAAEPAPPPAARPAAPPVKAAAPAAAKPAPAAPKAVPVPVPEKSEWVSTIGGLPSPRKLTAKEKAALAGLGTGEDTAGFKFSS